MSKRDYYEVLGVDKGAEAAAIKSAYRRLAMKYHPDRNPDDSGAEQKFKEIQEAYACLSDEQKRAAYDQYGHAAFDGSGGFGGFGGGGGGAAFGDIFDDVFSNFFSGAGGAAGRGRQRRQRVLDIKIGFDEMAEGCKKDIRLELPQDCKTCNGSGAHPGSKIVTCRACDGSGQVRARHGPFSIQQTCGQCRGAGRTNEKPCATCSGHGKTNATRRLSVNIPAGVDNGVLIRVNVQGSDDEIYLRVHVTAHPLFARDDANNLHVDIPISMTLAALGGEVNLPSLKGKKIKIAVPEGVQTGQRLRVSGRGLPNVHGHGKSGDLYVRVIVETPVNLSKKQKDLLREFEGGISNKTRAKHSPKESGWLDKVKNLFTE